ncbi:restriction endonuclease subunit S [Paeniglutamicibacter sp. ANT13_2]|uniref:Restriction endonuclease subunit S n=2 Tax=Paeniglutamicibacter terrestris TaxID=2723403 RepID=A0ABX1G6V3_9MICC|nr:restriction endonuclease subunit S [Paeniglutamicibacter terrestris]NKG22003.1 restriction endonuclease subunit S [Paeniglutamicibacter terrestris]
MLKASEYSESGVPVISVGEVGYGTLKLRKDTPRVSPTTTSRLGEYVLETNDIVFGRKGAVDRSSIVRSSENGWFLGSDGIRVRLPSTVNAGFIAYQFQLETIRTWLLQHASGSTMLSLNQGTLERIPLLVPTLAKQHAIADVLCALDDKIAANTKLATTSSLLAQSVFAAAADNHGVEVGLSESSSLLSRGITPKYSDDEESMVVLNQKCVRYQRVGLGPARRTILSKVRQDKELHLDDVLVNSTGQGTLGRVARWTLDGRVTVDSHITIVRFNPEVIDPVCGGFAVLRNEEKITAMAEGSTGQTELSRVELGKLKLMLPPSEQQRALGQHLAKMTTMENAYLLENQALAATRDALLPQLMSGKLRVKDAEQIVSAAV